jgi:CheY-like chemotaxis protein
MIVDDDPDLCAALTAVLEEDGFSVQCASQGTLALEMMRADKPDLIFLDIIMRMPTEGVWVAEEMAQDPALRDIPIVMLTSIVDSEYAGYFPTDRPLRARLFLDKPVSLDKILELADRFAGTPSEAPA